MLFAKAYTSFYTTATQFSIYYSDASKKNLLFKFPIYLNQYFCKM